ncbi:type II toxin-antitoxin system RelE/ParE family toxin [Pseudomonas fluorescens]|jgi:plasmid stabilization system protein ParE|nr:type II toxin-antitoxin system RelE/ParE family toxin [Pseudomonas fluorescens]MBD8772290.1 type II toxin-antitoxin system RelE/ParE family toxin [Pseudomonas fluorescens]MBD8778812.1 type II toxin-antitoxin system RelE/ParE family toxin [Pseudomonas fluorescens]MBD8794863.1 type II toxin-antitoxin system RelE/ParE family toxin [Pseudomonas fluorescens]
MALKWTSKALSDLARLYDFLSVVNRQAAARTVQALSRALKLRSTHKKAHETSWAF